MGTYTFCKGVRPHLMWNYEQIPNRTIKTKKSNIILVELCWVLCYYEIIENVNQHAKKERTKLL